MPIVKCDYCGKEVFKEYVDFRKKKHYCSKECKNKSQYIKNNIVIKENYAEMIIKDKVVFIDIEDIAKVNAIKWNLKYDETIDNYYIRGWERNNYKNRVNHSLHRYLLNCPKDMEVDHINRNTLDNRRENLRCVSPNVNKNNKGFYCNNKSGYKYIYWSNAHNTYQCEIKRYKKIIFRKTCKDLEKLVEMRDKFIQENIGLWQ